MTSRQWREWEMALLYAGWLSVGVTWVFIGLGWFGRALAACGVSWTLLIARHWVASRAREAGR